MLGEEREGVSGAAAGGPTPDLSPYKRIWPVDRALVIHTRSRVLKGTRTKLTLAARFLALSGYMKWCVVRLPASSSKPTVGARLILGTERGLVGPGQEPSGKHSGLGCLRRQRARRGEDELFRVGAQGLGTSWQQPGSQTDPRGIYSREGDTKQKVLKAYMVDSGLLHGVLAQRDGP